MPETPSNKQKIHCTGTNAKASGLQWLYTWVVLLLLILLESRSKILKLNLWFLSCICHKSSLYLEAVLLMSLQECLFACANLGYCSGSSSVWQSSRSSLKSMTEDSGYLAIVSINDIFINVNVDSFPSEQPLY